MEINALTENLFEVQAFVDKRLEAADCPIKIQMQIALAVEEIYVNIASYAYEPGTGTAVIRVTVAGDPAVASITFMDRGIPYDPLAKEDPDVTLSAEQRRIGGLGIFMTKQVMDEVEYEYKDGWNVFTMRKILTAPAPGRKGAPE
ncbi:MAG: ATP-binding protein [Firmicutes bacterium]|nr:ATP-binding protein [Bacillota bacterium]